MASIGATTTTATAPAGASLQPFSGQRDEYRYALSYAQCMRSHGLTGFPDPVESGRQLSFDPRADSRSPASASASAACRHLLPNGGGRRARHSWRR